MQIWPGCRGVARRVLSWRAWAGFPRTGQGARAVVGGGLAPPPTGYREVGGWSPRCGRRVCRGKGRAHGEPRGVRSAGEGGVSSEGQNPAWGGTGNLRGGASWWNVGSGGPWVTQQRPRVLRGPSPQQALPRPPPGAPRECGVLPRTPPSSPPSLPDMGTFSPTVHFGIYIHVACRSFSEALWEPPTLSPP